MMEYLTKFKKPKRQRTSRSDRRLGKTAVMESRVAASPFAIKPALTFWKINSSRITGLLLLLLCVWIIYLLFRYDSFYVYGADIKGNHILSAEEIYAASQIHTLSVFWVDPKTVKANVEKMSNVKTAQVQVSLPANVSIQVTERHPEVVWQTGDALWWIDNEGTFARPKGGPKANENRLRIIDADANAVKANDTIDPAIIRGAQLVHERKPEIKQLYYSQTLGLFYTTPDGWYIYLGASSDILAKLIVADAMLADLNARQVTPAYIDARNPRRGVYREQVGE